MVKRKWLVFAFVALGILIAVCIWSLVRSNFGLEVTNYSFRVGGLTEPIRVVRLTHLPLGWYRSGSLNYWAPYVSGHRI